MMQRLENLLIPVFRLFFVNQRLLNRLLASVPNSLDGVVRRSGTLLSY